MLFDLNEYSVTFSAYSVPHVVVYSERGMDIFNAATAEWLQTLSLRRVDHRSIFS